jgi:hypothetical protein
MIEDTTVRNLSLATHPAPCSFRHFDPRIEAVQMVFFHQCDKASGIRGAVADPGLWMARANEGPLRLPSANAMPANRGDIHA